MEEEQKHEEVVEQEGAQQEEVVEEEVKESERERNLKAENARKALKIQQLQEELDAKAAKSVEPVFNPQDLSTWKDHELKAVQKDPQYVAIHDQAQELLEKRRFQRFQKEESEKTLRLNAELERQKQYPETLDPTHPMSVRMSELMYQYRLENNPAGRLVAARLASSESKQVKAAAAGRKAEQNRQADVKANFQGESGRPAPKVGDKVKLEELKKRAMEGDPIAKAEWFKIRGLI